MVAVTPVKFNCFAADIAHKKHDFSSDTIKLLLTNSAPSITNTVKTDITEIAAGGGYVSGGITVPLRSSEQSSGAYRLALDNAWIMASGTSIANWRWAVAYNATSGTQPLMLYYDYGTTVSIADGKGFAFLFNLGSGVLNYNPIGVPPTPDGGFFLFRPGVFLGSVFLFEEE